MNATRHNVNLVTMIAGLALAAVVALAACSAVDPNPPNPHEVDGDPDLSGVLAVMLDGGADGATEGGP